MEIIEYKIQKGDTLESIAKEYNITVDELVDFHNKNCGITQQIIGNDIPFHKTSVLIKCDYSDTKVPSQIFEQDNRMVRYRTKQINLVKINDVVSAHSSIKCEYLVEFINRELVNVKLEDSIYNFYTKGSEHLEHLAKISDQIKKETIFKLNDKLEVSGIVNMDDISNNWNIFKNELSSHKIFKNSKSDIIKQIIDAGNIEYNTESILLENCRRNLFFQTMFGKYLTNQSMVFIYDEFDTQSHFFPQIKFKVNCNTNILENKNDYTKYLKTGKPEYVDVDTMIILYEKFYREQVEFKFTNYLYDYDQYFVVSKKDGLISEASINIDERIKNNLQSQVIYELKKVEL